MNDRYTIGNIIKGKVPDNYFSKDDKELTLNGVVQKRLMLPEGIPYVDAYRYSPTGERIDIGDERYDNPDNVEMPVEEAIEEIVIFEDEYPKYIGSTTVVPDPTWEDEKVDDKPTDNKYPIYTFKDNGLKNFTEDFRLPGELHLIFQTGKLAGLDFALNPKESDNTGTTFEIVRNEDYGRALPDDVLFPQAAHMEDGEEVPADTYVLYGFDTAFISEQMMPESEQELLETTKKYVKKSMIDPSTYDCEMAADFIYNKGNIRTYEVGAKVNLINKAYFPNGRQSRIIGFEWPLDIPYDHPIYTVGETAAYSRIGEIESKLDNLTYKGQTYSGSVVGSGGVSIYVIGVNDKTLPSDRNVFSSKKSLATFLNKTQEETMDYLIRLLGGVITDNIESQNFISGALGTGFLIKRDPKTGRSYAEFDEIYVRLKAVFESLTIKELQSVGGEILLTLASIECTKVEKISVASVYDSSGARLYDSDNAALYVPVATGGVYRCYFTADDGEKAIINQFAAGDMAQCRQFNIKAGVYENVANRYYWRYVLSVGENYIDLSVDDCEEGSDIPQAGDKIIQLGNKTDPARQNAILLSAYGLTAPTIQMLQGIDSYTLEGKAVKEEGFDQETQQFYSNNYGRSYVGDRDKNSFIQFDPVTGLKIHGAEIDVSTDNFTIKDRDGNQIAVFEIGEDGKPRLKADNINADELLSNGEKWALKKDGSGFLASNNIEWDKDGLLKIRANISYPYIEIPVSTEGIILDLSKGYNIRLAYGGGGNLYVQTAILPDPSMFPSIEVSIFGHWIDSRSSPNYFVKNYNNGRFIYTHFMAGESPIYNKVDISGAELRVKSMEYSEGNYIWYVTNFNEIGEEHFSWDE